jgi:NADH-quinone oxidoreductase subunit M
MGGGMAELPNLLAWITFLPLLVGVGLIAANGVAGSLGAAGLPDRLWKVVGFAASLVTFGLSLLAWRAFDPTQAGYQFVEWAPWLPEWGIHWFVGLDGISLVLVVLTTFLMPLVLLASWNDVAKSVKGYVFFMLFLETGMLGAFVSLNLFQFYLFWELMLVPMYFIIGIWGGPRRVYAAIKFFLFTMVGSLLMLVAILVVYYLNFEQQGAGAGLNFDLVRAPGSHRPALVETVIPLLGQAAWWKTQPWLFAAFALAFGIKVPLVPFHTWLPDAHVEAPTGGSVILAGVLLKLGTYGFVRFALPLFPVAAVEYAPVLLALSLAGILYGALVAMVQSDIKKLVAYSSVAHLGFVVLGIFALNVQGLEGSVLQMVNHGLSTGALFLLVGMIYERRHTRELGDFGGVAKPMPVYAALFGIVAMSSIGLPALNGFVGEFLILLGAFRASPAFAVPASFGVVLAAAYLLWAYRRMMFGPVERPENRSLIDLGLRERAVMLAIIAPIVWIGVYPESFLVKIRPAVVDLLHVMETRSAASAPGHDMAQRAALRLAAALPEEPR